MTSYIHRYVIDGDGTGRIRREAERLLGLGADAATLTHMIGSLYPGIRHAVGELRSDSADAVALIIEGLPITPDDSEAHAELIALGTSQLGGHVFQYRRQDNGHRVGHVRPRTGLEDTGSSAGRGPICWHNDDAVFTPDHRCELITLFGSSNPAEVPTLIAPVRPAAEALAPAERSLLSEPRFAFKLSPDLASLAPGGGEWSSPRAILGTVAGGTFMASVPSRGLTPLGPLADEAGKALAAFQRNLDRFRLAVVVRPGTALIIANGRACHARPLFAGDRHLLRTLIRGDLGPLRRATGAADGCLVFDEQSLLPELSATPSP